MPNVVEGVPTIFVSCFQKPKVPEGSEKLSTNENGIFESMVKVGVNAAPVYLYRRILPCAYILHGLITWCFWLVFTSYKIIFQDQEPSQSQGLIGGDQSDVKGMYYVVTLPVNVGCWCR